MISGSLSAIRTLISSGAIRSNALTGRLLALSKTKNLYLRGVKEYSDRGTDFEALKLARLFQRYLRITLRETLLRRTKNSPFTVLLKGENKPLYDEGRLLDNFVSIEKLDRGYRVGFDLRRKVNRRMSVGGLLDVLENGAILDPTQEKSRKVAKWIWTQITAEKGLKAKDLGYDRDKKRRKTFNRFKIPAREFFNTIADKFIKQNSAERREFMKGNYSLRIYVRKKPKVNIGDIQRKKEGVVIFQERYG